MKKTHFEFGHSVKFGLYHPLESKDCIAQKISFDFQHITFPKPMCAQN